MQTPVGVLSAGTPASSPVGRRTVDLDLVIPAYNEETRIGPTLVALLAALAPAPFVTRISVVDNGCVDRTLDAVDRLGHPAVRVLSCGRPGKGAAVRTGVLAADAPVTGFIDADLSTPASAVQRAYEEVVAGADVVIGSRRCEGARYVVPQPPFRRLGSSLFSAMVRDLVGPVSDTQCGLKLFRRDLARELFIDARVDGFAFDVEVLARARSRSARLVELPVQWSDSRGSTFGVVAHGVEAFSDVMRTRRSLRVAS